MNRPTPFEVHESGVLLHGTKAQLTIDDDPNVTDKKFPGNPTRSYRTREPVRIVGELEGWTGHTGEQIRNMKDRLGDLRRQGTAVIYD